MNRISDCKVKKYVDDKWQSIVNDTIVNKAYGLGVSMGMFQMYKTLLLAGYTDITNSILESLIKYENDDIYETFKDLILEYKKENNEAENLAEKLNKVRNQI